MDDCSLQTDGTGKITSEVPPEKSMEVVIAVLTEECPRLQFNEPTKDATEYESECPPAMGAESEDCL